MNESIEQRCSQCGGKLKRGNTFCPGCGGALKGKKTGQKSALNFILPMVVVVIVIAFYFVTRPPTEKQLDPHQHADASLLMPDFGPMIAALPNNYDSLILLGNTYMDQRIYQMAIESYKKAVVINDSDPNVLTDLGSCYHAAGDYEKAIEMFEKSLAKDPTHKLTYLNIGVVYYSMNNLEKTREYWEKLIELYPEDPIADTVKKYIEQFGT